MERYNPRNHKKCLNELIEKELIHPESCHVYFSPSIQYDSLEVGMEVVEQMKQISIDTTPFIHYMPNEKAYIDNQGINIAMCKDLGIPDKTFIQVNMTQKRARHLFQLS